MNLLEESKFDDRRRQALAWQLFTGEAWLLVPLVLARVEESAKQTLSDPERTNDHAAALLRLQMVGEFQRLMRTHARLAEVPEDPFPQVILNSQGE